MFQHRLSVLGSFFSRKVTAVLKPVGCVTESHPVHSECANQSGVSIPWMYSENWISDWQKMARLFPPQSSREVLQPKNFPRMDLKSTTIMVNDGLLQGLIKQVILFGIMLNSIICL